MSSILRHCVKNQRKICFVLISITMSITLFIGYNLHSNDTNIPRQKYNKALLQRFMGNESKSELVKRVSMGINKALKHILLENKTFICDGGATVLKVDAVNDDFCDCKDGLDEPATNACLDNRFTCLNDEKVIPSSYMNDGICDCCDGTDEWKNWFPPDDAFHLPQHPIVKYAPCINYCGT